MRIIAGEFKGRTLKAPKAGDLSIRPSSDRLRESLFNILLSTGFEFEGSSGADLFAGTGALGFEAVSRGAERVVWVDESEKAVQLITANATALGLGDTQRFVVIQRDVRKVLDDARLRSMQPLRWIFMDPPYAFEQTPEVVTALSAKIKTGGFLEKSGIVILETSRRDERDYTACLQGALEYFDTRIYGEAKLHCWRGIS